MIPKAMPHTIDLMQVAATRLVLIFAPPLCLPSFHPYYIIFLIAPARVYRKFFCISLTLLTGFTHELSEISPPLARVREI